MNQIPDFKRDFVVNLKDLKFSIQKQKQIVPKKARLVSAKMQTTISTFILLILTATGVGSYVYHRSQILASNAQATEQTIQTKHITESNESQTPSFTPVQSVTAAPTIFVSRIPVAPTVLPTPTQKPIKVIVPTSTPLPTITRSITATTPTTIPTVIETPPVTDTPVPTTTPEVAEPTPSETPVPSE